MANNNLQRRQRRKRRVSPNIRGSKERPRVSVFRSNRFVYAQVIDDEAARTIVSYNSRMIDGADKKTKTEEARIVGTELAALLKKAKISAVVFDRGSSSYKGRVKALAEGLREGGIVV